MRRDLVHYYQKSLPEVFEAYRAAVARQFGKNCNAQPYHTLSFGLPPSIRYNMNGGSCTVHFMPYLTGTAVDIRYSVAQLAGARYGRHDKDLTAAVVSVLGVPAGEVNIDIDTFLLEQNKVFAPQSAPVAPVQPSAPVPPAPPVQPPQTAPKSNFCTRCGNRLTPGARFCTRCGNAVQ